MVELKTLAILTVLTVGLDALRGADELHSLENLAVGSQGPEDGHMGELAATLQNLERGIDEAAALKGKVQAGIAKEFAGLEAQVTALKEENAGLEEKNRDMRSKNDALRQTNSELEQKIAGLEEPTEEAVDPAVQMKEVAEKADARSKKEAAEKAAEMAEKAALEKAAEVRKKAEEGAAKLAAAKEAENKEAEVAIQEKAQKETAKIEAREKESEAKLQEARENALKKAQQSAEKVKEAASKSVERATKDSTPTQAPTAPPAPAEAPGEAPPMETVTKANAAHWRPKMFYNGCPKPEEMCKPDCDIITSPKKYLHTQVIYNYPIKDDWCPGNVPNPTGDPGLETCESSYELCPSKARKLEEECDLCKQKKSEREMTDAPTNAPTAPTNAPTDAPTDKRCSAETNRLCKACAKACANAGLSHKACNWWEECNGPEGSMPMACHPMDWGWAHSNTHDKECEICEICGQDHPPTMTPTQAPTYQCSPQRLRRCKQDNEKGCGNCIQEGDDEGEREGEEGDGPPPPPRIPCHHCDQSGMCAICQREHGSFAAAANLSPPELQCEEGEECAQEELAVPPELPCEEGEECVKEEP